VSKEEVEKIPDVDIIVGNNEKGNIVNIIEEYIANNVGANPPTTYGGSPPFSKGEPPAAERARSRGGILRLWYN